MDRSYNCIAWSVGENARFWWPDEAGLGYWPPQAPREETLAAFVRAYATLGYEPCEGGDLEPGFERVAIFADDEGPTHVARQLENGRWTSKLGLMEDIEHSLEGLRGSEYGRVVRYLRRPRAVRSGR